MESFLSDVLLMLYIAYRGGGIIQIQVMDWNKDPLMAPIWNSGIGYICLANEKKTYRSN